MSNIVLTATPGAGKGVVSKYLQEKYNLVHMSMGNLLREEAKSNKQLQKELRKGILVDDNTVYRLLDKFINDNKDKTFIFDGFPRAMKQVKEFESIIKRYNINIDKVIFIDIDKDIALKRITGRLMCEKCNHIFNKYTDDVSDICPDCGGKLFLRSDDSIEIYNDRYNLYLKETVPVIEYLKNNYNFKTISNNTTLEDVYKQIDNLMKEDE